MPKSLRTDAPPGAIAVAVAVAVVLFKAIDVANAALSSSVWLRLALPFSYGLVSSSAAFSVSRL